MSSSVESRILTMKFDNKQFSTGVADTMSVLKKLQTSIAGVPSSIPGFGKGTTDTSGLDEMGSKVGGISAKFVALSTVAITALANITNRAVDAGLAMGKSLTVQPILDGFAEYELKMGSIQTILSNTSRHGTTLKEVTNNLDELNEYADKTIYNFGDMTKNIGLFTNAGIKIEDATAMIKGFSNEAAASGTNAQGAASAAYQLSQALSAGTIRLMDWRSLQNVGMGNKNMQNGLIEIADAMGEFEGKSVDATTAADDFNGSLEQKWLTADVMQKYLKIQAGELSKEQMRTIGLTDKQITAFMKQQKISEDAATKVRTWTQLMSTIQEGIGSGWAETFDLVLGDFNEATKLFTAMNNAADKFFSASSDARNKMLKQWDKHGGRDALIEGMANAAKALFSVLKPLGQAFRDIFPRKTGRELADMTKGFRDLMESFIIGDKTMNNIRRTFRGLFAVVGIGWEIFKGLFRYVFGFFQLLAGGSGGVWELTGSVGDLLTKLHEWLVEGEKISGFFDMLINARAAVLGPLIGSIGEIIGAFGKLVGFGLGKLFQGLEHLAPVAEKLGELSTKASEFIASKIDVFIQKLSDYFATLSPYVERIEDAFRRAYEAVSDFVSGINFGAMASGLGALVASGADKFVRLLADGLEALGPILANIGDTMRSAFGSLTGAVGGFSLKGLFDIGDETSVAKAGIQGVKGALDETAGAGSYVKSAWDGVVAAFKAVGEFLSPVWDAIKGFFGGMKDKIGGFVEGMGIEEVLALINTGFFMALYFMFTRFTKKLGDVAGAMGDAFESIGGTFDQATSNLKTMQNDVKANMILKIAAAIAILAIALWILSKIPADKLGFALGAVATSLMIMMMALKAINKMAAGSYKEMILSAVNMTAVSVALLALGIALLAFAAAIAILGNLDTDTLIKGIGSVAAILAVIVAATAVLSKTGGAAQILVAAAAIAILAAALTAFAGVIKLFAAMDLETLQTGGLRIAAALVALGIAMQFFPPNMLVTAAGLFVVANALLIIAGAIKIMGSMSWEELAKGLGALAAALVLIGAAMVFMAAPGVIAGAAAMLLMATAIGILVPSIVLLGNLDFMTLVKGIGALAAVFGVLGLAGLILAPLSPVIFILAAAIGVLGLGMIAAGAGLMLFATGLALLAASGAAGIAVLVAAVTSIASLIPLILQQIGLGLIALAKVIHKAGPPLVRAIGVVLREFFREVVKSAPGFGRMLVAMIKTGLKVMRKTFPEVVKTGIALLKFFLGGVAKDIGNITKLAIRIVVGFINTLAKKARSIINAGVNLIISFIRGVATAIDKRGDEVGRAGLRLAEAIVNGMIRGLRNGAKWIKDAAIDAAKGALDGAMGFLGIRSPSKEFMKVGMYADEGFALGLSTYSKVVKRAAADVGEEAIDKVRASMARMSDVVDQDVDMSPVVSPVLDLSQVRREAREMGRILATDAISAGMSHRQAVGISNQQRANQDGDPVTREPETKDVTFIQNNNSPKALSHVEIHRSTRSLIALHKEELKK